MDKQAPELITSQWFNAESPVTLEGLRGRVVVVKAFQMLCPGCVSHALPQAQQIQQVFRAEDVAVIGLHTVFEHHDAMTPTSLEAFLHEYKIAFPVGVDAPSQNAPTPQTMTLYGMRGTPTTLLIDREGRLRKHAFGQEHDLLLGAQIMSLVQEGRGGEGPGAVPSTGQASSARCADGGCVLPPVS